MANAMEEVPAAPAKHPEDGAAVNALSFTWLAAVMSHYSQVTEQNRAGPVERWSFVIGLLGAGFGMLFGTVLDGKAGFICAATGVTIELIGFAIAAISQLKRELPGVRHPHAKHAEQMEQEFVQY
ncbi:hypothetical protein [Xanthomonas indica]|uniref:Uncharacterized protein n=1 Tax=Xanthomonas indica TaxID=2912242 RepID=A0AAU8I8T5_9XANT|nr:hypothetical protein [Xanthomonas indica]MCI2261477.1 hypothetical protein [Xanthomonas indica]